MHLRAVVPGAFCLLLFGAVVRAAPPAPGTIANPEITEKEVAAHVRYLASDELQGRGSGTPSNDRAADYIAGRFRAAGLKPAGEKGSFFQRFSVLTGQKLGPKNNVAFLTGRRSTPLKLTQEFMPLGYSQNGSLTAPVVFAGYGISQPELGYDDYAGLDVRDKIVIVLRHSPDGDDNGKFGPYALLNYKTLTARQKGAAGILLVSGPMQEEPAAPADPNHGGVPAAPKFPPLQRSSNSADAGILAAFVDAPAVDALLKPMGKNLKDLQVAMAHGKPEAFPLPNVRAALQIEVLRETASTRNVLALLEGSDPRLKDEIVVIGAHFDHLGTGGEHSLSSSSKPEIHHGADDNASGTAGVLELAQYFGANRARAGRSLLFMAFSGEELGLLGSAHWVKNPTLPLARVAAMVNLDMIGRMRNDTVQVLMVGSSPAWKELIEKANEPHKLTMRTGSGTGFGGSDHQSFYARQIPVLFFFTGVHPDYHRPSDTWEKVNAEGEAKLLRLVSDTTAAISKLETRPTFTRAAEAEQAPSPGFRVFLGTIPDYAEEVTGVLLQGVREGSPAEKAGVKAGDIIVELGGKGLRNVQEYTVVLGTLKPNVPTSVVVTRKGQRIPLTITPLPRRN